MNRRHATRSRTRCRGVAALECAFTLPVALFVLYSLLDLGLAAIRYNTLAEGARRIARQAIIHGRLSPQPSDAWGPEEFAGTAADDSPQTEPLEGMLPTMQAGDVEVEIAWLDGDNSPRDRVRVELRYRHRSIVPLLAGRQDIDLRSTTTMNIVN
jgi:hypothetical protein